MLLPESFAFNQANLQDFVDCQFRFLLRHVRKLEWPAIESEPVRLQEEKMDLGFHFHRVVQQYFSGVPARTIEDQLVSPDLSNWWEQLQRLNIEELPGSRFAEKVLTAPFAGSRLIAKYDLLTYQIDGSVKIYDWKTSIIPPSRKYLIDRIQSKVYPAVLCLQDAKTVANPACQPESVEMTYWFPEFPGDPVSFSYSQSQFEDDLVVLNGLIQEIMIMNEDHFIKTDNEKKCRFCRYRSFCDRGVFAGNTLEMEEIPFEDPFNIDFDVL